MKYYLLLVFCMLAQILHAQRTIYLAESEPFYGIPKEIIETKIERIEKLKKTITLTSDTALYNKDGVPEGQPGRLGYRYLKIYKYPNGEKKQDGFRDDAIQNDRQCIDHFNQDGTLVETHCYALRGDSIDKSKLIHKLIYKYDQTHEVGYTRFNADGLIELKEVYKFNQYNLLSQIIDYDQFGKTIDKIIFTYIGFDKHKNWVRRKEIEFAGSNIIAGLTITTRHITYF